MAGKRPLKEEDVAISFSEAEMEHVTCPHEDTFVIYDVKQVLIDLGSSTDVLFLDTLKKMG